MFLTSYNKVLIIVPYSCLILDSHPCDVYTSVSNPLLTIFFYQLKQSASDKLGWCDNVKIDWGLNEVRLFCQERKLGQLCCC